MHTKNSRPCVLCFCGLDPSGGAGLQADIEAIAACGGHALPIATCLTVQNSVQAFSVQAIDAEIIQHQFNALIQDINIAACKISIIPNDDIAMCITELIKQLVNVPIVYDPVLKASHGSEFTHSNTLKIIRSELLPNITVATPNAQELKALLDIDIDEIERASQVCENGPSYILATGADNPSKQVHNTLLSSDGILENFTYERLPLQYHGSGCTLSSALASYLAQKVDIKTAARLAQDFTHNTLKAAITIGKGQAIPRRIDKS